MCRAIVDRTEPRRGGREQVVELAALGVVHRFDVRHPAVAADREIRDVAAAAPGLVEQRAAPVDVCVILYVAGLK